LVQRVVAESRGEKNRFWISAPEAGAMPWACFGIAQGQCQRLGRIRRRSPGGSIQCRTTGGTGEF
jgi:hypothetical protein